MGYFGRNEEGNGKNERPDKVIAITLPGLKHLFIVVTISFLIRCFWIQKSLSGLYQLIHLMRRVVQTL